MAAKETPTIDLLGVVDGQNPSALRNGAQLILSKNVVLREASVLESRRGQERAFHALRYDRMFAFGGSLFLHAMSGDYIKRADAPFGAAGNDAGTASHPSGRKMRTQVAGGRLFLTTGSGLKVLDTVGGTFRAAGGPVASSLIISNYGSSGSGFLPVGYTVAYRYTIGRMTSAGLQIIGPPSGRVLYANQSGAAENPADIDFTLPPGLDDTFFIQLWRSSSVPTGVQPEDDLRLVYERPITQAEAVAEVATLTEDLTPDSLRGEYLYTSPNAGEGIQNANHPPPMAEDVVLHKDRLWVACTTQPQEFTFRLLAVGGTNGLAANDKLVITGPATPLELVAGTDFTVTTGGSASQNVETTAIAIVQAINLLATNQDIWAEYVSGPDDVPGEIRLYGRSPTSPQFALWVDQASGGAVWSSREAFAPELLPLLQGPAGTRTFSLQRVANVVTATISSGNLTGGLKIGDRVVIPAPLSGSFGVGPHIVTGLSATTFTYSETGANAGPSAGNVVQFYSDEVAASSAEAPINRVHFSKPLEFEAFPRGNFVDVGSSSARIVALAVTRETLWVFKEDGLWRVTGDDEDTFDLERTDETVVAVAPDCVVPFAESVIAWTTRGVVRLTEGSFEVISSDIDPLLREWLLTEARSGTTLNGRRDEAFMVADSLDGLLRLHLPGDAVDDDDAPAGCGEALVWCVSTKTWARWEWPSGFERAPKPLRHGVLEPTTRIVYYCDGFNVAFGEGNVWRDRRAGVAIDFRDYDVDAVKMAIQRRVHFIAQFDKAPLRDKRWDEVVLFFRKSPDGGTPATPAVPTSFRFGFASPLNDTAYSEQMFGLALLRRGADAAAYLSETPVAPSVRIMVPTDYARGQYLLIGIASDVEDEDFGLFGFSIIGEVLNQAIVR